jgi:hypothetical protein
VLAFNVDLPHQLRERRILCVGNGPQSTPKSILKTDASLTTPGQRQLLSIDESDMGTRKTFILG